MFWQDRQCWYFSAIWLWCYSKVQRIKSTSYKNQLFQRNSMSIRKAQAIRKQQSSTPKINWKNQAQSVCRQRDKWNCSKGKKDITREAEGDSDSTDICSVHWFATTIPLLWKVQGNNVMILTRENMHKGKQKRRKKEQLCSISDFSARILPIQEKIRMKKPC